MYSPVVVLIGWAFTVIMFGRSTGNVIAGLSLLGVTLGMHTREMVYLYHSATERPDERHADRGRGARRFQWRENWYRDWWLFILSVLVLLSIGFSHTQNKARIADIQRSRLATIRAACVDQNARHDFALTVTFRLLSRPAVRPVRPLTPQEMLAQRAALKTWVNALVPHRDCDQVVRAAAEVK